MRTGRHVPLTYVLDAAAAFATKPAYALSRLGVSEATMVGRLGTIPEPFGLEVAHCDGGSAR